MKSLGYVKNCSVAPANTAQPATKNVAQGVANV